MSIADIVQPFRVSRELAGKRMGYCPEETKQSRPAVGDFTQQRDREDSRRVTRKLKDIHSNHHL